MLSVQEAELPTINPSAEPRETSVGYCNGRRPEIPPKSLNAVGFDGKQRSAMVKKNAV